MRTATFEERYFKNTDEWNYFLSQIGISESEYSNISVIEINVDGYEITDVYVADKEINVKEARTQT